MYTVYSVCSLHAVGDRLQDAGERLIFEVSSNQITPLPSLLLKQHVDWLEKSRAQSEPLCLLSIYRARIVVPT